MNPQEYQPKSSPLSTPWAKDVSPDCPLPEYPRPQMVRGAWQNLNGLWDFAITAHTSPKPDAFPGVILVPFPIESALSGVNRRLQPDECLWYQRQFTLNKAWENGRVLLHFGAVDWECRIFINKSLVGEHTGGYTPFSIDITRALQQGTNEVVIAVRDPSDSQPIQRGKQVLKPDFIWYSTISGIWQTVWLEHVPDSYIQSVKLTPNIDQSILTIEVQVAHGKDQHRIRAMIMDGDKTVTVVQDETEPGRPLTIQLVNPLLWSPETPHLYDLSVSLLDEREEVDMVKSYFGMRKFSLCQDTNGRPRFCLNNQPLFLYGPLDQGYWPDGLYTPPTDDAMQWEIDFLKDAGFNMLRKHIKIEPARYYYHCDRKGIIVWQDMISGGISPKPIWFFFAKLFQGLRDDRLYWRLGRRKPANRTQFRLEYQEMIDALYHVVSIAIWGPFNEGWGQFDAAEIAAWTQEYDPTRLVDHASGWFDQGGGDFKSLHVYFKPLPEAQLEDQRALVLSEFGGYSLNLPKHAWIPEKEFGYKKFRNRDSLTEGYVQLLEKQLIPWIRAGLSAAVYTQTTDVEIEVNGFITYDRKIVKMDLDKIREIHQRLYEESCD